MWFQKHKNAHIMFSKVLEITKYKTYLKLLHTGSISFLFILFDDSKF
jgi:hypothetical protein